MRHGFRLVAIAITASTIALAGCTNSGNARTNDAIVGTWRGAGGVIDPAGETWRVFDNGSLTVIGGSRNCGGSWSETNKPGHFTVTFDCGLVSGAIGVSAQANVIRVRWPHHAVITYTSGN